MDTIHTFDPLLVKLDSFEGPLDLLLHLIQDKKLDIHTLSLATLCAPFLSYVKNTSQIQLENASQFIYIAASLIAIKALATQVVAQPQNGSNTTFPLLLLASIILYIKTRGFCVG